MAAKNNVVQMWPLEEDQNISTDKETPGEIPTELLRHLINTANTANYEFGNFINVLRKVYQAKGRERELEPSSNSIEIVIEKEPAINPRTHERTISHLNRIRNFTSDEEDDLIFELEE